MNALSTPSVFNGVECEIVQWSPVEPLSALVFVYCEPSTVYARKAGLRQFLTNVPITPLKVDDIILQMFSVRAVYESEEQILQRITSSLRCQ